jgi:hypothetical protein
MKRMLMSVLLIITAITTVELPAESYNVSLVGEYGTGIYEDVYTMGNYAYCAAGEAGLDIIDIEDPTNPRKIGSCNTGGAARDVEIKGNVLYALNFNNGMVIFDLSNPAEPKNIGTFDFDGTYLWSIKIAGQYLYMTSGEEGSKLQILDISNPAKPTLKGNYIPEEDTAGFYTLYDVEVKDNYAYVVFHYYDDILWDLVGRMHVLDISDPGNPTFIGKYTDLISPLSIAAVGNILYIADSSLGLVLVDTSDPANPKKTTSNPDKEASKVVVHGNHAYLSNKASRMEILDVSNPTAPVALAVHVAGGSVTNLHITNRWAYLTQARDGLQILDISNPAAPVTKGEYNRALSPVGVYVKGNYAYLADESVGMRIIDVSTPGNPVNKSVWAPDDQHWYITDLEVNGDLALITNHGDGFYIVDVSDATAPKKLCRYTGLNHPRALCYKGNDVYIVNASRLEILDISNPENPTLKGGINFTAEAKEIAAHGDFAYVGGTDGLKILDISDPANPSIIHQKDYNEPIIRISVKRNLLYMIGEYRTELRILDISNPYHPEDVSMANTSHKLDEVTDMYVADKYAYFANYSDGILVMDISEPTQPRRVGHYSVLNGMEKVYVQGDYIYATSRYKGKLYICSFDNNPIPETRMELDKTVLNFTLTMPGRDYIPQTIHISRKGEGNLFWKAIENSRFIKLSSSTGIKGGTITVGLDTERYLGNTGEYRGTITVTSPYAVNSPQNIDVVVRITENQTLQAPFGAIETPLEGATVSGSIPVTGWALDDMGVQSVEIFREMDGGQSLFYIGDATMVEGARPDVGKAYPTYPYNTRAGWGYMLLTNYLPNGGNGSYRLHAVATDYEGNQTTLGIKTINCDNANAVNPFGAIDTPEQGGIASGSGYVNFGWVLTPQPNTVPKDGRTINVWVDGINLGNPRYNKYREDIAAVFPGYNNSSGAVGYFYIDTTQYDDGVHTIQWTAKDDAGNADGIGSRFFIIQNDNGGLKEQQKGKGKSYVKLYTGDIDAIPVDDYSTVRFRKGFDGENETRLAATENDGSTRIRIKELERLEIHLEKVSSTGVKSNWKLVNPVIGSTMDTEKGRFYWSPGPGFVGTYRLTFTNTDTFGRTVKKTVWVNVSAEHQQPVN